jgi:hypothetical protein
MHQVRRRVRVLKGSQDERTRTNLENIYKAFSGYVHANYAHIMEMYNGGARDFSLAGVASAQQRQIRMEYVAHSAISVLHAAAFVAHNLGLKELHHDIAGTIRQHDLP